MTGRVEPDGMSAEASSSDAYRVLVLAPTHRDMEATRRLLEGAKIPSAACDGVLSLVAQLESGVGAILMTDAALSEPHIDQLLSALGRQPPWSDVPIILLCRTGSQSEVTSRVLNSLRNVTLLERPSSSRTLLSSVQAAIRARARQYEMREQFDMLRRHERQLHTLTENIPDVLSRFDTSLRHTFVNRAATRVTGISKSEFLGRTNRELGTPAQLCDLWEQVLHAVFLSKQPRNVEFNYSCPHGVRFFSSLLVPEFGDSGAVETVLSVAHDITDAKRAEEALQMANRRKDEFLAMLAHELRNPLAPILIAAEILARTLSDDTRVQPTVDIVRRQAKHLTQLVDDLLDVARITEGRIQLQRVPIEVSGIISQALETAEPLIREKQHSVLLRSSPESLYVEGDQARLVQSFSNVLINAAKYTDPGGQIGLEVQRQDATVAVVISDNGAGITKQLLPRIFDLFVQDERSADRSQGGLGIGLALVQRLIEMHNGQVTAFSAGPGSGSTFTIRLPLIDPPVVAPEQTLRGPVQPKRILIVDDNVDAANSLALMLELDGHKTEALYRSKDAIDRALAFDPDIVLLDIGLPEMNGYEVATHLRRLPGHFQIIALTGYGQIEDAERAEAAGFDAHLVKPVDIQLLREIVDRSGTGVHGPR